MTPGNRQPLTPDARWTFLDSRIWNLRRLLYAVCNGNRPRRGTTNWRLLYTHGLLKHIRSKDLASRINALLMRLEDRQDAVKPLLDADHSINIKGRGHAC